MTIQRESIRNIGIIAHVDAGKTTLTERVLFYTGRIRAIGEVHHGDTQTDHHPIERKKGITITAAAVRCEWDGCALHLIDTPGHADFAIEVERSLRVLDGAVVLLDGVAGVEPQTEKVWRQADRYGIPRLCFVNKLDRPGASFARCLDSVRERLGATPVVVAWPVGTDPSDPNRFGLVDLVRMRELRWTDPDGVKVTEHTIRESCREEAKRLRAELEERCADADARFEEALLGAGAVDEADFVRALRAGTAEGAFVPTLGGSALANRGVQPLLDAVVAYLPPPEGSLDDPLVAFCFKVTFDRFGQLTFVRVYAGALRKGAKVRSSETGSVLRVGRIVRVFADDTEEVDALHAGEIGAIVGSGRRTGETLSHPEHAVALEPLERPEPVVRLAIEPKGRKDRDRLGDALARLLAEDPSLRLFTDPETGQTLLGGLGQLHLEVTLARLGLEHGVQATAGAPRVAFRETIRRAVVHEHRLKKQSGGPGQFAKVRLALAPLPPGSGLVLENDIRGGVIAAEYIPSVHKGAEGAMQRGALAGYPVTDVRVTLVDGEQHPNDSSQMAFEVAAGRCVREALGLAEPALLEPIMALEVLVGEGDMGAVIGDLGARRAKVIAMDQRAGTRVVRAEAPLSEMFGYADRLHALTHGRGQHAMTSSHYARVPDAIAKRLLEDA